MTTTRYCQHVKTYESKMSEGMDVCYACGNLIPRQAVPLVEVDIPDASIQAAFTAFHLRNPKVYEGLVTLAREWKAAGNAQLGISMLWDVLRWKWHIEGLPDDAEEWKLNNNYKSRYARLIMTVEDDLDGMFETRELRAP